MIERLRRWCWSVAAWTRIPLPALHYHHAALEAAQERDYRLAQRLFARATAAYRRRLDVDRLAHARLHELFVELSASGPVISITELEGVSERINRLRGRGRPGHAAATIQPGDEQRRDDRARRPRPVEHAERAA